MSSLNDELILERLVENVSKDLIRRYPINVVLALDYCYQSGEEIPNNYLSGVTSKVVNKRVNSLSNPLTIDKSSAMDCLFIRYYESLLSSQVKGLIKNANTTKDFKGIVLIDLLSKNVSNSQRILISNNSLDSKIFSLAKAYKNPVLENNFNQDYNKLRELSLKVNSELNKPFNPDLAKYLFNVRKDLTDKLKVYSKYPSRESVHEMQNLIISMRNSIGHKFRDYIQDVNHDYGIIKNSFENNIWDNEKRINTLIGLKSDIEKVKRNYQMVLSKEGVDLCKDLEVEMQNVIDAHYNLGFTLEEFKSVKTEVKDYYHEVDFIFSKSIMSSTINRLNEIYSRLNSLANIDFPSYIPSEKQNDYYSRLNDMKGYIQQKCAQRVTYLVNQSTKYRHKADKAFFSGRVKKFGEELKIYNNELKEWSKCQVLKEI